MTSPQAADIDKLMALADDFARACVFALQGNPYDADAARATLRAALEAALADAQRYRWLRGLLWQQELSAFSKDRVWLWSARFASSNTSGGDLDPVTQGQELDAIIDQRLNEDAIDAAMKEPK